MSPVQLEQPVAGACEGQRAPACRAIAICGVSATANAANINEAIDDSSLRFLSGPGIHERYGFLQERHLHAERFEQAGLGHERSGSDFSAVRLSSIARSIDCEALRDFSRDGRVERAVSVDGQLLERGDGVRIVLLGELQFRRRVTHEVGRPAVGRRPPRLCRPRSTRPFPASITSAAAAASCGQAAASLRRKTLGRSTFAAMARHTAGEGVSRSSVAAVARMSFKSCEQLAA